MQEVRVKLIENFIAVLALVVSGGALALAYRADSAAIAPNVISLATTGRTDFAVSCSGAHCDPDRLAMWFFDLKNVGRANVQVVSAELEVLTSDGKSPSLAFSAITDAPCKPLPEVAVMHEDKVLGIKNPLLAPDSVKKFCVLAVGSDPTQTFLGSRAKLGFSNGQSIVVFSGTAVVQGASGLQ